MEIKNKLYFSIFTAICIIAAIICVICDFAISKTLTWSLISISSIIFAWLILLPSMILKKKTVIATLLSITIFIVPFLYILSVLTIKKEVFSVGAIMSIIGVIYLWVITGVFQKFKQRKYIATGISILLAIPVCLIINLTLSKIMLEPIIDIWDILTVFILLTISIILFIINYYKSKK